MRWMERLIVLVAALAIFCLFPFAGRQAWIALALTAAVLVAAHAMIEGMHWQMGPAYAAVALLFVAAIAFRSYAHTGVVIGIPAALFLIASIVLSWILPMFRLPQPTGEYPVGTVVMHLSDPNRMEMHAGARPGNREVVVQWWYPSKTRKGRRAKYRRWRETTLLSSYQAVLDVHALDSPPPAEGKFPVIVHNPGWHGLRNRNTCIFEELASHGFAVASLSHPWNSSSVELSDGIVADPDHTIDMGFSRHHYIPLAERFAMAEAELIVHTEDTRFVLDEMQRRAQSSDEPLAGHLMLDCVGSAGYSFGGAVASELAIEDPRVRSVLELDGVLHGAAAVHGVSRPFLMIDSQWILERETTDEGDETSAMWKIIAQAKSNLLERCGGMRVALNGFNHGDFSDQIYMSPVRRMSHATPGVDTHRVAHILRSYVVAFFRHTLKGTDEPLLSEEDSRFPEATLRSWSVPASMQQKQ